MARQSCPSDDKVRNSIICCRLPIACEHSILRAMSMVSITPFFILSSNKIHIDTTVIRSIPLIRKAQAQDCKREAIGL